MSAESQATLARPGSPGRRVAVPLSADQVARAVNTLARPVILENLFQTALDTANMTMVGALGSAAIAGFGSAMQVVFVLQAAFSAVTTGTTVLIAHAVGAHEDEKANLITKQSIVLGVAPAVAIGLIGYSSSDSLIARLGADPEAVRRGGSYLRITMVSGVVLLGMFIISGALRGGGDTRTPMIVTGLINLINIVACYVLVFGHLDVPGPGVDGAAWAAAISRTVGCAVLLGCSCAAKACLASAVPPAGGLILASARVPVGWAHRPCRSNWP